MKSLQDYINTYRKIAEGLEIKGDSTELLIQLLANASYISEVENIAYSQEASLERATTMNSKIQHCINNMYSVYRGQCPRLILNIKPTKIINWTQYDAIISSNNFKVYYLGYYKEGSFRNDTLSYYPIGEDSEEKTFKILCLLAKETFTASKKIQDTNRYYIDNLENNLSNDIQVTIDNNIKKVTRLFSEHILGDTDGNSMLFDLTLPSFGSRIYFNDLNNANISKEQNQNSIINVLYFKRSKLIDYNESELKNISLKGIEIVGFEEDWLKENKYTEFMPGKILIPEVESDDMLTVHYKANQIRHLGSIFKSNNDLGNLLKQRYPWKVKDTSVVFENIENKLTIYYIPDSDKLNKTDIENFNNNNKAYYIIEDIDIVSGVVYNIKFDIEVSLYETGDISEQINDILLSFSDKFNINFIKDTQNLLLKGNSKYSDIETQISKNPLVRRINKFNIQYSTETGEIFEEELANDLWNLMIEDLIQGKAYYKISSTINQVIQ